MIISKLRDWYPHGVVELNVGTTASPTLRFSSGKIEGHFKGSIKYNVRLPSSTLVYAFTTTVVCKLCTSLLALLDYLTRVHEIEIRPTHVIVVVRPSVSQIFLQLSNAWVSFKFWLLFPWVICMEILKKKNLLFLAVLCATAQRSYCRHAGVRRPSAKPVFSEPVKQINVKFGGKVSFHHTFRRFFFVLKTLNFGFLTMFFLFVNMGPISPIV